MLWPEAIPCLMLSCEDIHRQECQSQSLGKTKQVPTCSHLPNAEEHPKVWLLFQCIQLVKIFTSFFITTERLYLRDGNRQSIFLQRPTEGLESRQKSLALPEQHEILNVYTYKVCNIIEKGIVSKRLQRKAKTTRLQQSTQ